MPVTQRPLPAAQDPTMKNSPIAWESDEESEALRAETPDEPMCYFNDAEFADGAVFHTGGVTLRCERGVWVASEKVDD